MLTKHPETELEYWATIEELGGFIHHMNHGLAHGRIKSTVGLEQDIMDARNISEQLVGELFVNFGVVAPKDCPRQKLGEEMPKPPYGFKWYWSWYKEMKENAYREAYDNMICSACPLSKGVEDYLCFYSIPCSEWPGILSRLPKPYLCAMVGWDYWTEEELMKKILEKGGEEAIQNFKSKKVELINDTKSKN